MISPRERRAARTAPDRAARIEALADLMAEHGEAAGEGLTAERARAAGFTRAEIEVYADAAVALRRRRAAGHALVREAQALRGRRAQP